MRRKAFAVRLPGRHRERSRIRLSNARLVPRQTTAIPRRQTPGLCFIRVPSENRGRRECRVLAATHGPRAVKKARGRNHRFSRIIRHSLRNGFNAYSALSLGTGLSCSHRPRDHHLANLASASGGQDHAPSPSASASLVWRRRHVHRSPHSTSVTTRPSLFGRGGMAGVKHTFPKNGREIFCT